jgi:hypothetical protein
MTAIAAEPVAAHRLTQVPLSAGYADDMAAVLADPDLSLCASSQISPPLGRSSKPSMYSSVDFPQPLGPNTATVSPRMTSWSTPLTAWTRLASLP